MGNLISNSSDENVMDTNIVENVNIFKNIKNCISRYFDFKDPDKMVLEISKYVKNGDHSEYTRKQLYYKIFKNLNHIDQSKLGVQINRGSFGAIYEYENDKVLKVPLGNVESKSDALIEIISNIVYQCYEEKIIDMVPIPSNFRWPFPHIYKCAKIGSGKDNNPSTSDDLISIAMNKVKTDCWSISTMKTTNRQSVYISIMIQTAIALYGMQESIGFIHRDLHPGNVMIDEILSVNSIFKLLNKQISINTDIMIYIIDLGQSCANLSKCMEQKCDNLILEGPASSHNVEPIDGCFNRSFDLRLFTGTLAVDYMMEFHKISGYSSKQMRKYLDENSSKFSQLDKIMTKIYIHAFDGIVVDPNRTIWHQLYPTLTMRPTRTIFTPELFFDFILKNLR